MRCLLIALLATLAPGCAVARRTARVATPTVILSSVERGGAVAVFSYLGPDGLPRSYAPTPWKDTRLSMPMVVDERGTIRVSPLETGVRLRVFLRHTGLVPSGFMEVVDVTGERDGTLYDELRWLPGPVQVTQPVDLPVRDLVNVYNGYTIADNDLILIETSDGTRVQRALFQNREVGFRWDPEAEILVRVPFEGWQNGVTLSPALMGGISFGWNMASPGKGAALLLDRVDLVITVGIGSTTLEKAIQGGKVEDQVSRANAAALIGGGIKLLDLSTVELVINAGQLFQGGEPYFALGFGLDIEVLRALITGSATKIWHKNTLSYQEQEQPDP